MNGTAWFSDVTAESTRVTECSMWVNQDPPSGGQMNTTVNVEMSTPIIIGSDEKYSAPVSIAVSVEYSDVSDASVPRAKLKVRLSATMTADKDRVGDTWSAVDVRTAAAAMLYPQIQAYLNVLGGMAGIGAINTPAIRPDSLAEALAEAAGE